MTSREILYLILHSVIKFPYNLIYNLRSSKNHLWRQYDIEKAGNFYVFRETINRNIKRELPIILVFHFRLKLINSNKFFHWLFRHVCIITTPFWSGLPGFRTKLWMSNKKTKDYMGIYQWYGLQNAHNYIEFLTPILGIFAIKKSMWYRLHTYIDVKQYLSKRLINN